MVQSCRSLVGSDKQTMVFPASILLPSSLLLKFPIKYFRQKPCQVQSHCLLHINQKTCSRSCMQVSMSKLPEPDKFNTKITLLKAEMWDALLSAVKDFTSKKAMNLLLERLWFVGQKAIKWSLILVFTISSLADAIYSISRNQEMMIPLGLLVGCLMAHFLKEIYQQVFYSSEGKDSEWQLIGIGCFLVLVKFLSYFALGGQLFLLHVANGGFLQILWLWIKGIDIDHVETSLSRHAQD